MIWCCCCSHCLCVPFSLGLLGCCYVWRYPYIRWHWQTLLGSLHFPLRKVEHLLAVYFIFNFFSPINVLYWRIYTVQCWILSEYVLHIHISFDPFVVLYISIYRRYCICVVTISYKAACLWKRTSKQHEEPEATHVHFLCMLFKF